MTIEELKNEAEIQNLLNTSHLANTFEHNMKCIQEIKADEKTKEKLLNEIKKEFASKSLNLRKQLEIVLNEIENAKNLDNIVIDDLFKKAQAQIEEQEQQQRLAKEIEIKEKIKEKQKQQEELKKLQNQLEKASKNNDLEEIYKYLQNIHDDEIKNKLSKIINSMVSKIEELKTISNHNNDNSKKPKTTNNKKSNNTTQKKDTKTKLDSLNQNNIIAKGANKLGLPKAINKINKIKKAYDDFINNKIKIKKNTNEETTTKEKEKGKDKNNNKEDKQNTTQKDKQNTNQNKENNQDTTQKNTNKKNNKTKTQNANKNKNKNNTAIEMDPVHKAIKHIKSKKYQENIKGLLDSYEEIEQYYFEKYRKKDKKDKNETTPKQDKKKDEKKDENIKNKKEKKLSTNNTKLNGGTSVGKISNLFNFFKNNYLNETENTSKTK